MTVTLNIQNDEELRAYIKDVIKGQVLSIGREEIFKIISSEMERKIKGMDDKRYSQFMKEAFEAAATKLCYKDYGVSRWGDNFIKPFIDDCVNNALKEKDWDKLIDDLAREKIRKLI